MYVCVRFSVKRCIDVHIHKNKKIYVPVCVCGENNNCTCVRMCEKKIAPVINKNIKIGRMAKFTKAFIGPVAKK